MSHEIHSVRSFIIIGPYTLRITFEDAHERIIDFSPVLHGPLYGPLKESTEFIKVTLDPEIKTLVWPNGADFDPAILYNWNECAQDIATMTQRQELALVMEPKQEYGTVGEKNTPIRQITHDEIP